LTAQDDAAKLNTCRRSAPTDYIAPLTAMVAEWFHMMLKAAAAGGPTSMMAFPRL